MMLRCVLGVGLLAATAAAQLSVEQKVADFEHLAALYAKQYGPYEWKRDFQRFDLLDVGPWLTKVRATRNDLEFFDVMSEYVASLNDAHDVYTTPSSYTARLNFTCDIYDGKVLVDSINRTRLPANEFPFAIGYEVVAIDGQPVDRILDLLLRYAIAANPRSTRRQAANFLTLRPQSRIPWAPDTGDIAVVEMRRLDGKLETHRIPWTKTGLPLRTVGPVPTPRGAEFPTDYWEPLRRLQNFKVGDQMVLNSGARAPLFQMPQGFVQRLGLAPADFFFSGTFQAGGYRIGFLRIPSYAPADLNTAANQFLQEVLFLEQNTDGLIIDQMRNPGGSGGLANLLAQLLMPRPFRTVGIEVRATSEWVVSTSNALESAKAQGAPQWLIDLYTSLLDQVATANREFRGRTGPIPIDGVTIEREPLRDSAGRVVAYSKPLLVLCDEFSASGGDLFAATIQINRRGLLYGMRTMGAGGNVVDSAAGVYSEGATRITQSLMHRGETVRVEGYPETPYIENVGVHPDIVSDYMTRDNLLFRGRSFVAGFTAAMVEHIRRNQ